MGMRFPHLEVNKLCTLMVLVSDFSIVRTGPHTPCSHTRREYRVWASGPGLGLSNRNNFCLFPFFLISHPLILAMSDLRKPEPHDGEHVLYTEVEVRQQQRARVRPCEKGTRTTKTQKEGGEDRVRDEKNQ